MLPYREWSTDTKFFYWGFVVLIGLLIVGAVNAAMGAEPALHPTFQAMIDATNAERRARGYAPLVADPQLQAMAEKWGKHMATTWRFEHSNYPVAENIAAGQRTVPEAMASWMKSSGHRANILGGYSRIGCAAYKMGGKCYWVQCFK